MRVMVRPILMGISRMAKTLDTDPLDKDEIESGEVAFAALMYQYGAMLDARVLVALWVAGVSIPRALQYMEQRKKKETLHKQTQGADSIKAERVVQGTVVSIKQGDAQ